MIKKIILATSILIYPLNALRADISRNNYVDWIAASSKASSSSHFIQWKIFSGANPACVFGDGHFRTRISIEDKELYSLLLSAKVAGKKVGFYYETNTDLAIVPGHGTGCEITNAWLESD